MQTRPPALPRRDRHGKPTTRPARRPRRAIRVALVVAGIALLGACSTIRVFTDFGEVLRDAGFGNVAVTIDGRGAGTLVVSASAPPGDTLEEAHDRAAELTWLRFPRRFEQVRITIDGDRQDHTRAELAEAYGPRPASLDETDLTDEVTRFGVTALVAALVGGLLFVVAVVVTILLVVRGSRKRQRQGGGGTPQASPPGTWPRPGAAGHPPPWAPPGAHAHGPVPPNGPPPPAGPSPTEPGSPPTYPSPVPMPSTVTAGDDDDRRHLGRRPRGPVPPASQTPPGWER